MYVFRCSFKNIFIYINKIKHSCCYSATKCLFCANKQTSENFITEAEVFGASVQINR